MISFNFVEHFYFVYLQLLIAIAVALFGQAYLLPFQMFIKFHETIVGWTIINIIINTLSGGRPIAMGTCGIKRDNIGRYY